MKKNRCSFYCYLTVSVALMFLLGGCATPHVVQEKEIGDKNLSCEELVAGFEEAARFEKKARKAKGMTGMNIVSGLVWWPGLFATYSNADDAIDAARERQRNLTKIHEKKNCEQPL